MILIRRPMGRTWDVQTHTGSVVSTVPGGNWARGPVIRGGVVALRLPPYHYVFDAADPLTIQARMVTEKTAAPVTVRSG